MKRWALTLIPLALVATLAGPAPVQAAGSKNVEVQPTKLEKGPQFDVPRIIGDRLVYRDERIDLPAHKYAELLGQNDEGFIVNLQYANEKSDVVLLTSGSRRDLVTGISGITTSAAPGDGALVITNRFRLKPRSSVLRAYSASDGSLVGTHTFKGSVDVRDAGDGTVVLGSFDRRATLSWSPATDAVSTYVKRTGGQALLARNLLSSYTKDPYQGGCTIVSDLEGTQRYWKNCSERVWAFSPDGKRMATVDILADGLGPGTVWVRTIRGKLIARYSAPGYFGLIQWESNKALLLETFGKKKTTIARCVATACERAWKVTAAGTP